MKKSAFEIEHKRSVAAVAKSIGEVANRAHRLYREDPVFKNIVDVSRKFKCENVSDWDCAHMRVWIIQYHGIDYSTDAIARTYETCANIDLGKYKDYTMYWRYPIETIQGWCGETEAVPGSREARAKALVQARKPKQSVSSYQDVLEESTAGMARELYQTNAEFMEFIDILDSETYRYINAESGTRTAFAKTESAMFESAQRALLGTIKNKTFIWHYPLQTVIDWCKPKNKTICEYLDKRERRYVCACGCGAKLTVNGFGESI